MKITKRQLRRIIKEEKAKLQEANFGGYDSIIEEVMQELNTYYAEVSSGGDHDRNKMDAIENAREATIADVIWPRLEEQFGDLWDNTLYDMSEILFRDVSKEWLETLR